MPSSSHYREGKTHTISEEKEVTVEGRAAGRTGVRSRGRTGSGAYGSALFPAEVIVKRFVATTIKPDPTYDYSDSLRYPRAEIGGTIVRLRLQLTIEPAILQLRDGEVLESRTPPMDSFRLGNPATCKHLHERFRWIFSDTRTA